MELSVQTDARPSFDRQNVSNQRLDASMGVLVLLGWQYPGVRLVRLVPASTYGRTLLPMAHWVRAQACSVGRIRALSYEFAPPLQAGIGLITLAHLYRQAPCFNVVRLG